MVTIISELVNSGDFSHCGSNSNSSYQFQGHTRHAHHSCACHVVIKSIMIIGCIENFTYFWSHCEDNHSDHDWMLGSYRCPSVNAALYTLPAELTKKSRGQTHATLQFGTPSLKLISGRWVSVTECYVLQYVHSSGSLCSHVRAKYFTVRLPVSLWSGPGIY